jgi:hypothetical protein
MEFLERNRGPGARGSTRALTAGPKKKIIKTRLSPRS